MDKRIVILSTPGARDTAIRYVREAPDGWVVRISEPTRNLEQNAKLHAILSEISAQVDWYGNHLTKDEWRVVFAAALRKQKVVPGIDGGFVVLGLPTHNMGKMLFSELIELAIAFAAQHGVKMAA